MLKNFLSCLCGSELELILSNTLIVKELYRKSPHPLFLVIRANPLIFKAN